MTTTKSKLGLALASGRLVLTAECLPPRMAAPAAVKQLSAALPSSLDAVVVADNPDGIHGSALACAAILAGEGRATVLSMVTRDRNRIALESDARARRPWASMASCASAATTSPWEFARRRPASTTSTPSNSPRCAEEVGGSCQEMAHRGGGASLSSSRWN